jgi:hypothetical protein
MSAFLSWIHYRFDVNPDGLLGLVALGPFCTTIGEVESNLTGCSTECWLKRQVRVVNGMGIARYA